MTGKPKDPTKSPKRRLGPPAEVLVVSESPERGTLAVTGDGRWLVTTPGKRPANLVEGSPEPLDIHWLKREEARAWLERVGDWRALAEHFPEYREKR